MQAGDLVRFKPAVPVRETPNDPYEAWPCEWNIGLLIRYETWEKVGTVLYEGKILRIRAENMQKAGKKDGEKHK